MAQRPEPSFEYITGLCRRNAMRAAELASITHPGIGFDRDGVRWLDQHIAANRSTLTTERTGEFVQFMGCFYGECLIAEFGGSWEWSSDQLGIRMDRLGFTYPFNAVTKQIELGQVASVADSFSSAVDCRMAA